MSTQEQPPDFDEPPFDDERPAARAGEKVTEGFGTRELAVTGETASSALAEQARASVQARYVMAMQRPRSWDTVRVNLLNECKRKSFAAVGRYRKPVGGGAVEGFSIRFAEAAMRCATNMLAESPAIHDDARQRIVRVIVTDLESNSTWQRDVVVRKVVERSKLAQGQTPISSRTNSSGRTVYLVEATDEDLLNKENALVSKAVRTGILRLMPGDILDECEAQMATTRRAEIDADPAAARRKVVDAFAALNVSPTRLEEYLGHPLAEVSPAELDDLRALYQGIKDGETTFAAALEERQGGADAPSAGTADKVADLKAKLDAKRGKKAEPDSRPPAEQKTDDVFDRDNFCRGCQRERAQVEKKGHAVGCEFYKEAP